MILTRIDGLPAHVLFVHFVVVAVPLTALAAVVCAVQPRYARRIGLALPLLGLVTLGSVPLATHAGEWLASRVGDDPLVRKHTEMGDGVLPWVTVLFLVTLAVWWLGRHLGRRAGTAEAGPSTGTARWNSPVLLRTTAAVLAVAVSAGAVVDVYRVGESGAKAAWHGNYDSSARGHHG